MIIKRHITTYLRRMLKKFPILSLTGPRQSGKTTLLRNEFPDYKYYNLERIDIRDLINSDPAGFLNNAGEKVILDEVQNTPDLFSYLQVVSDERGKNGQYILSGSQSFLLNNNISQSLAGRISINNLFPFDITELNTISDQKITDLIVNGFYPRLHDRKIRPSDFYPSYLQRYVERDIRTLRSVENLQTFSRFLTLCAARTGQILNLSSLANDTGVSLNTAKAWLSLLEASFIVFLLHPWYNNINKRIIKSPKIYFYDTGVVCSLLRITEPSMVYNHYLFGFLYENLVISEIIKCHFHNGIRPNIYYWRESNGAETDCIIEKHGEVIAIEVKSAETFNRDFLRNLNVLSKNHPDHKIRKYIIYNGSTGGMIKGAELLTWKKSVDVIRRIARK